MENYKAFFNSIDDFLFVLDMEGNIITVNDTVINRLQYTMEELVGKSVLMVHQAERRDEAMKIVGEMIAGKAKSCPVPIITKSEMQIPVETRITHGTWDGQPALFGVAKDISQIKLSEERLSQAVDRLKLATRAGGVGIWEYDVINNKLVWDEQMYRLYGVTSDKFSGAYDAWQSGLHPEDKERGDKEIQMAIKGEKEFDTEFRVLWPDGTVRYIRAIAIVERDETGKVIRMVGTNWDITNTRTSVEELKKLNQHMIGRELKMVELKKEIEELKKTIQEKQ